jgi:hypothetical protein
METSVSKDSALYDITIAMAQQILQNGFDYLGAGDLAPAETPPQTQAEKQAVTAGPSGSVTIRNSSGSTSSVLTAVKIYKGFEAKGELFLEYNNPVLGGQQASWDLPEGIYTFAVFLNNRTESSDKTTLGVTADDVFVADFYSGNLSPFSKK